eukprot:CAMPEP_0178691618 /NCGR_PEP_ID=MMETSP0699-20121125/6743_1 /TAXON_ID=265572 /ORGANISM="Extubocellulus spinifer, Strain CCMP396" /LENGTH=268 /DNA_ID=CAMNT_0020336911 /DNA_START=499 /DNA_END=1305 /DNA_ORIENTATION=+
MASSSRRMRRRFDAKQAKTGLVAAWIVFFVAVIIGGVIISQSVRSANEGGTETSSSVQASGTKAPSVFTPPPTQKPKSIHHDDTKEMKNAHKDDSGTRSEPTPRPTAAVQPPEDDSTTAQQQDTSEPTTRATCGEAHECISDRLGQNEALRPGQAICSRDGRYMFGMDSGSLIWKDCTTGETKRYYRKGDSGDYFIMDETAKFAIYGEDGQVKWERNCKATVTKYEKCLSKPEYDCPYLHLHKGGVVVLNYIDGWDWISKNIKKMYDF